MRPVQGCWPVVVASCLLAPSIARAQNADEFGIERFRLATGTGLLDVDDGGVPGHKSWTLGLWGGFARDPLVLYDRTMPGEPTASSLVEQRVTTGLVGSIALWNRVELGVGFDAIANQSGDMLASIGELPSGGIGNVHVSLKGVVIGAPGARFHAAIIPAAVIPVGSARGFLRENGPVFEPRLALGFNSGRVRVGGNVGYRLRERFAIADLVVDDEVFARAGVGVRVAGRRDSVGTELALTGSVSVATKDPQSNQISGSVMLGVDQRAAGAIRLFAAGGVGVGEGFGTPDARALIGIRIQSIQGDRDDDAIADRVDRCPDEPEDKDTFEDGDGCIDPDNDRDGVPDDRDRARDVAEDKDGFEDDDGAPELDNDKDGIADASDKCPDAAEDKDGDRDTDGCADPDGTINGKVVDADGHPIPGAKITLEQVDFPTLAKTEITGADDGAFKYDARGGTVKMLVSAAGYQPKEDAAVVADGKPTSITVTLVRVVRQGVIKGQVLSFAGKPIPATITVSGKTAKTDADGFFSIELPEGTFSVVVEAKGYATQKRSVSVKLERVTVLNVDMRGGR